MYKDCLERERDVPAAKAKAAAAAAAAAAVAGGGAAAASPADTSGDAGLAESLMMEEGDEEEDNIMDDLPFSLKQPNGLTQGLSSGLLNFGKGVGGAAAFLVAAPIQGN